MEAPVCHKIWRADLIEFGQIHSPAGKYPHGGPFITRMLASCAFTRNNTSLFTLYITIADRAFFHESIIIGEKILVMHIFLGIVHNLWITTASID
jgi:hypothetical protein